MKASEREPNRLGRNIARVPVLGILATVLILVTSAGASATAASVTLTAPYRGTVHTSSDSLTPLIGTACAKASLVVPSTWHASTGSGGWDEYATANGGSACTGPNSTYGSYYSTASSQINLAVPIGSPSSTGTHTVIASWHLNFSAKWSILHNACPKVVLTNGNGYQSCSVRAGFSLNSYYAYLIDLTTGQYNYAYFPLYFSNYTSWFHDVSCYNYSYSTTCTTTVSQPHAMTGSPTVSQSWLVYWNSTTMNSSHKYALEFSFYGSVQASIYAYPQAWKAGASASLNVALKGNGLFLKSISIK